MGEEERVKRIEHEVFLAALSGRGHVSAWALNRAAALMRDVSAEPGDVIFRPGDPATHNFLVTSGEVKLSRPGAADWVRGPRSFFGMTDAVLDRPYSRLATATRPSRLLQMATADWFDLIEDSFELTMRVIFGMANTVHTLRLRAPPLGGFDEFTGSAASAVDGEDLVARTLLLRQVPLLADAGVQALTGLAELADVERVPQGAILHARHTPNHRLVVIASGAVVLSREEPAVTATFGPGSSLGGTLALDDLSPYEARAFADATVLSIFLEDYFDLMEEQTDLFRSALRALVKEQESLLDRSKS
jgi:CRP-like cAMP-binding protein